MCGISGIIYNKTPKQTVKFKASANLQSHRGPDYTGYFGDELVDLIHHRLSIIDLDPRANQPFKNTNGDKILVYNGEIYNYRQLSESYNLELNTSSDTEVLCQLLDTPNFNLAELNGIFAFAYYDVKNQKIDLCRDRLGVKPLYYYKCKDYFMFASEAKVIYDYLDELKINYQALSEFMAYGHSNGNETMISGVKKLMPGTSLKLDIYTFQLSNCSYWKVEELVNQQIKPTYDQAKIHTTKLLEEAVKRQCISDVPVGAYLSGGIDSSAIVALASKHTDSKLMTYSVDFEDSSTSELKAAAKVAKQFNTEHHEFQVSTTQADAYLEQLIYQYDEPFADPAMIPLHLLAEKAAQSSKVVLQGDGGDELFAGYGRYLDVQNYRLRKLGFLMMKSIHPNPKTKAFFDLRYKRLNHSNKAEVIAHMVEKDVFFETDSYFTSSIAWHLKNTNPIKGYYASYKKFKELPLMQSMLYTDMENILSQKYLEKVDKVNMWHGIEARVPLLDNELVDYVMRLPQEYKIKKGITKYFLRDILKGLVPDEILNDRKRSFGTPFPDWTVHRLYTFALKHFEIGQQSKLPFNYDLIIQELKVIKNTGNHDNATLVWKFLVLTIWLSFYKDKITNIESV
jgi:asparagine synthase (glutamine-hydrolysing)